MKKRIKNHNWARHDLIKGQGDRYSNDKKIDSDFDLYKPKINGLEKFLK